MMQFKRDYGDIPWFLSGTTLNSEYPATLHSAQIGSRCSPTSGTRRTVCVMLGNKMIEYKGDHYESSNI